MRAVTTRTKRMLLASVLTGLMATAGVVAASPAQAHNSTYCGHGRNGIIDITEFLYHYGNMDGQAGHHHVYYHHMRFSSDHIVDRFC